MDNDRLRICDINAKYDKCDRERDTAMEIQLLVKTKIIKFSVNPRTWAEGEKIEEVKSFKFFNFDGRVKERNVCMLNV